MLSYRRVVFSTQLIEGLDPSCMYNADETGLIWRKLPKKVMVDDALQKDKKGPKLRKGKSRSFSRYIFSLFKLFSERVTVMLACNASGTHMVKPAVIGQHRSPRAFNQRPGEVKKLLRRIYYHNQDNSWVSHRNFSDVQMNS